MNSHGRQILKDVSRSFYLSIRLLPGPMREPVSLAYLLARASDTLADTEGLDAALRHEMLLGFGDILKGADRASWIARLEQEVIPRQSHQGEKLLLAKMDEIFDWLYRLKDSPVHAAILRVMEHILHGQGLDMERFELRRERGLASDAQLEEYCFLVAGCVGEFWSEIGNIALPGFSTMEAGRLKQLGIHYGMGLQLINILRDLPSDLKAGRCYLPVSDPDDINALQSEAARWRARARQYLGDGQVYTKSLGSRRTRAATALPGLIGQDTLDLLDHASWEDLERGVKVSRIDVYRSAWQAFFV
ncbi:MAG: phytoene/squalene synthase family protein [Akkermansiaceae bacterium]